MNMAEQQRADRIFSYLVTTQIRRRRKKISRNNNNNDEQEGSKEMEIIFQSVGNQVMEGGGRRAKTSSSIAVNRTRMERL
jgi:hypothetical protein